LCYRVKLTDEGLRTLAEAETIAPGVPDVYYLQGRLYIQKGENAKARPCLERALELGHPDAEAVLKLLEN
jgi:tetratricopeptide (TPR) repeat protein